MPLRFWRRVKVAPGVTLNLSKTGTSVSLGPRGAKTTLGHGRVDLFWPLQHSGAQIVPLHRAGPGSVQAGGSDSPVARYLPLAHELPLRRWLEIEPLITWVVGLAIAWHPAEVRNLDAFERAWAEDAAAE